MIELKDQEFLLFQQLILQKSGIHMTSAKRELVRARLLKRLRAKGMPSFKQYYCYITQEDSTGEEINRMLDVISTHPTSFFREPEQFHFLANRLLPALTEEKAKKRGRNIRGWSAGCSTGEEPYSIAMTFYEWAVENGRWVVGRNSDLWTLDSGLQILATDISQEVLEKAARGIYPEDKVRNIPLDQLQRHFQIGCGRWTGYYRVKEHLKKMICFKQENLFEAGTLIKEPLDFIFCRNVLIYFNKESQKELIHKFYGCLQPGGYLFLGHSESLVGMPHRFQYIQATIYRKV